MIDQNRFQGEAVRPALIGRVDKVLVPVERQIGRATLPEYPDDDGRGAISVNRVRQFANERARPDRLMRLHNASGDLKTPHLQSETTTQAERFPIANLNVSSSPTSGLWCLTEDSEMRVSNLNQWMLIGVSILVGATIPLQAAANAKLGETLSQPLWAAFIAFTISAVTVLAAALLVRAPFPVSGINANVPTWSWFGGIGGAIFIAAGVYFVPRIGAANFLVATVAGQLVLATLLDHRGWLGVPVTMLEPKRAIGIVMVLLGACLFASKR